MRTLLIDDFRPIEADVVAKTYDEGIAALVQGPWDLLLLDHDLGEDPPKDGYGIMKWLEINQQYLPRMIQLVTSNPVGRKNMERVLQKFYRRIVNTWIKVEEEPSPEQVDRLNKSDTSKMIDEYQEGPDEQ
jgi:hypothetical protein